MTPRRSSGGPQCAFEENKKERERRAGEQARELSPEKEPPGATSAAAAPEATQRSVGRAATSASVDCIFN